MRDALREQWVGILRVLGICVVHFVAFFLIINYNKTYMTVHLDMSDESASLAALLTLLAAGAMVPVSGWMSDRVGRRPVLMTALVLVVVLSHPLYLLMRVTSGMAVVAAMALGLMLGLFLGTVMAAFAESFDAHGRYGGFSIGYNVASMTVGGSVPLVVEYSISTTGHTLMPAHCLVAAALVVNGHEDLPSV